MILRPLYRELHTWARYELAQRYGVPVPEQLPAHWLPNRWGQDWGALVEVKGLDLDGSTRRKRSAEWIVRQGEQFYRSLGFDSLPASFWTNRRSIRCRPMRRIRRTPMRRPGTWIWTAMCGRS